MSGPYQGRDLSNCGVGRLCVAINCGVLSVKSAPFSLAIDGSSDAGLENMNPMTIQYFDARRVKTQLLDMCLTSGVQFKFS